MNNLTLEKEIIRIANSLLHEKGYISTIDILLKLGYLKHKDLEDWRFGRVSYLERVCGVNLSKLSLIQSTLVSYATRLNLKKSLTIYHKYGKGAKRALVFSKSGNSHIEKAYSTHYLNSERIHELKNQP